jgi:beta-N-acetylhexosaminidase
LDVTDTKGYKKDVQPPYTTAAEYRDTLMELQRLAMERPLGIPLHFSFDQEGGTSADFNFGGVKIFPKPMGIRASGDPSMAYEVARAVSRQGRAVGFNWIHSPVLDINTDPQNPEIYTRAYSDNAETVAQYALESCRGFKEGKMIATGKHFPGRGDSAVDAHYEIPVINVPRDTMLKRELLPYKILIGQGVLPSVMIAHSIFPAYDGDDIATVSKRILTGLLREELGFDGVITTDSMTMGGVAVRYGVANACAMSVEAGADLVLMKAESGLVGETVEAIKGLVTSKRLSMDELDKKVGRVLGLKYEYGLFTNGSLWHETPEEAINAPEIAALSKKAARRSVVVLNDIQNALPLSNGNKMLIIEQTNKTPNDIHWHPGVLYKHCMKYNRRADYLETEYTCNDADKEAARANIGAYETVVVTNFYIRSKLSNNEFITDLIRKHPNIKFVVVTNTPYRLSIPQDSRTTVLTLSTAPDSMEAVAGVLFGAITAEGEYPVSNGVTP